MDLIPIMIIDSDDSSRYGLKSNLEDTNFIKVIGDYNNLITGYNAIIKENPSIVFIDISDNSDLALEIIEKIFIHHRSCIVFVLSYESSADIVIKAMRAGAREFITKPIQYQDLNLALEKAKSIINSEFEEAKTGKIFTVFSNKGGIGKTTIATNLAISLADITGKRVALVDLNLQLGDVTTFLDINPSFDISYVVTHLNRIDESFLLSTLEKYKDKELYILADPPYLEQAEEITSEQITNVLNVLKSVFSYIIVDTSSSFDSKTLCALDMSDNILLVSMINLPSIRNSQRCLELFNRLGYTEDKIKLLINRYMPSDEISVNDVEDVLGHSVYWKISNNYFTVMSAINKGLPVFKVDSAANISRDFMELSGMLSNTVVIKDDKINNKKKNKSIFALNNILMTLKQVLKSK